MNMEELNQSFEEYMESVKKLDIAGKRKELYESLIEFGKGIVDIASAENIELHFLQNREINDLYKESLSEDDYLEAILVYVEIIKNLIGEYLLIKEGV